MKNPIKFIQEVTQEAFKVSWPTWKETLQGALMVFVMAVVMSLFFLLLDQVLKFFLVRYNMVDAIVATGASIVDMDFFEALGFKHYQGSQFQDDTELRNNYIDRIYDTYIDEEELQMCDKIICEIANTLEPKSYTSREFIHEMGKYLKKNSKDVSTFLKLLLQSVLFFLS